MAPTKQVLRLQSDQILDDPQAATRIRLKDLLATQTLNLLWIEPAVFDRDVTFKDPGANDAVVYENLAQPLNNKTLGAPAITDFTSANHDHSNVVGGGTVAHASIGSPAIGDDHTQYAILSGRAGGQVVIGGAAAGEDLSLQSTSDATRGDIVAVDNILMGSGKEITGLSATPSGPTAATSKAYVDLAISGGASWKETLLTASQLDSTNDAVANAVPFYLVNIAQIGDTITVDDGATSETWTFAAAAAPNQPAIGATALDSMTSLAARITADSVKWTAMLGTALQGINPTGNVVIIYRVTPTGTTTDRIYGVFTTPTDAQLVDYGTEVDYRSSTSAQLPAFDPAVPNFGFGRITATLRPNDAHLVRLEDSAYIWNEDAGTWQLSAGAVSLATSGPGGATVGQSTFDEDFGLQIVGGGIARVRVDGTTIAFTAGELSVSGGAIPFATSGPGGATEGKVTADEGKGLLIIGGPTNAIAEVKVDASSIAFNLSGELTATGAPLAPTGNVSVGELFTRDIIGVTPPTPTFISTDIPTQDYPDAITTGQLFDFVVPADYDSGAIEILASFQMTTSVAVSSIALEMAVKIVKASSGTVDTGTFPLSIASLPVPGTTALARIVLRSFPNPSGTNFQRGDTLQVYVKRVGGDGADSHTGTWRVAAFQYRYLGQINTRLMEPVADIFMPVSGTPAPPAGFFSTDVPVINYSDTTNQAAAVAFVVPDNWDGTSDALLRVQYALDTAASGTVRLNTSVEVVDVTGGSIVAVGAIDFDLAVTADVNPHRTVVIRSVPGANLSPGSVVQITITRDTAVGGNAAAGFLAINATCAFGVAPVSGISALSEYYMGDPVYGNLSGTVFAGMKFPAFAGNFEQFYTMNSTAAAGVVHAAFAGRLASTQTSIDEVSFFVEGVDTGTVTYDFKVYAEGSAGTPVYAKGVVTPPGASTQVSVSSASLSAQPTGNKKFFVVIEALTMSNGESVSISKPLVRVS